MTILAYEVNPHALDTAGAWTYGGRLRSPTMTSHPRIDSAPGEMFMFGYEAGGLGTDGVAYFIADQKGNLKSEQWFKAPYCSVMHDFGMTEYYGIFPVFPTKTDLACLKSGGVHWTHDQQGDYWVGILPRYGKSDQLRWFKGPKGVYAFHFINAFEEGGLVHLDICLADTQPFPFIRVPSGIHREQRDLKMTAERWSFDLNKPGDLPRLLDRDQGRPCSHFWMPSMNPQAKGPPVPGGPVGASFNCLLRIEPATGRVAMAEYGPATAISEPVHVPSKQAGHDGWLLVVIDHEISPQLHWSELLVLDATKIAAPLVARIKSPVPLHPQIYGCWVAGADLARSRISA